jgi:hypothetical protein
MTALGLAAPRERERAVTAGFCCRSGAWKMAWRPCLGEFGGRIEKEKWRLKRGIDLEQSCSLARRGDGGRRRPRAARRVVCSGVGVGDGNVGGGVR